jgi:tetratricopeptide (TPR) repeat protein
MFHYSKEMAPIPVRMPDRRIPQALAAWLLAGTLTISSASVLAASPPPAKKPTGSPASNTAFQEAARLVEEGNRLANSEQYAQAIPLYEKAIKLLPQETQLKKNLAVLYANYGVQLQNQQAYPQATQAFEHSLAIDPNQPPVKKAMGANYYYQAMEKRQASPPDPAGALALMKQAIATDPTEPAFRQGLASIHMEIARDAIGQDKMLEAIQQLEAARQLDPASSAIKVSLVNVYLRQAQQQEADRAQWLEKALALDSSESTRERVSAIRENKGAPSGPSPHPFMHGVAQPAPTQITTGAQTMKKSLPPEALKLSVDQMLRDVEKQLELTPPEGSSLKDRLETAETQVLGSPQTGTVNLRTKTLYAELFGQAAPPSDQGSQPQLAQAPVETSEHAYLDEVFKLTEGRVIRWGKFPLRVYIDTPKDLPDFRPEYVEAVNAGLEQWKNATHSFVTTVVVKNRESADVLISWSETYTDRFASMEEVPDFYKKYAVPKANPMLRVLSIASMLTPGYFSLAPQALGAAMQYQQVKKIQTLVDESKITLGLAPLKGLSKEAAQTTLKNMTIHEFGHVLGLKAHSPQAGDVMYPVLKSDTVSTPSSRDIETLRQLYARPANIVLNIR